MCPNFLVLVTMRVRSFAGAVQLVDEHIRQAKEVTVATIQARCHEGVCELLGYVLWQHVSNASDCPDIHVARATQGAHLRPHVHGRIKDGTKVASGLTEGDADVADFSGCHVHAMT